MSLKDTPGTGFAEARQDVAGSGDLSRYRTVAVSPHFDDVALSVAGLIARLPGPAAIVTVHGGSPPGGSRPSTWDLDCGFVSAAEAYQKRLAEDALACELLGADQIALPNADGPYRDGDHLQLLDELLLALPPGVDLYLPMGINQPDHLKVRDQALAALSYRRDVLPLLYADLPYAGAVPGWGTGEGAAALARDPVAGQALRNFALENDLRVVRELAVSDARWFAKRNAVLCYASQLSMVAAMDELAGAGPLLGPNGPLHHELVWQVAASSTEREPAE